MPRRVCLGVAMLAAMCGSAAAAEDAAKLFVGHCSACHQKHGQGTPNLAPPLVSPILKASVAKGEADYAAKVVVNGLSGKITINGQPFISAMPARVELSDAQVAAVVTYVLKDLNGIDVKPSDLPDAARIAALRKAPVSHAELRRIRQGLE